MGAVARTKVMGYTVIAGDDTVRFDLPTDIFGNTSYFSARGVGISKNFENSGFYVLGGLTSQWMGSRFFQAARSEDPTGSISSITRPVEEPALLFAQHFFSQEHIAPSARMGAGKMVEDISHRRHGLRQTLYGNRGRRRTPATNAARQLCLRKP